MSTDAQITPPLSAERAPARIRTAGQPRSFLNADDLYTLCQGYFGEWEKADRPVTVIGLCVYLGITRETFSKYLGGTYDTETDKYSDTLKMAREFIENDKLEKSLKGKYAASIAIFDLKNNHGYADKVEQTIRNAPNEKFKTESILTAQDGIDAFMKLNAPGGA